VPCRSSRSTGRHPCRAFRRVLRLRAAGLVEEARTQRYRNARKYRYRRPYYVPYACSRPYQYRYWQFYAPICYPL